MIKYFIFQVINEMTSLAEEIEKLNVKLNSFSADLGRVFICIIYIFHAVNYRLYKYNSYYMAIGSIIIIFEPELKV